MFSLIVTIIAVALVAALALATIYYGGSALDKGTVAAAATRAISQGQQIEGAMDLYRADFGEWPTKEQILGANSKGFVYLRAWPDTGVKTASLGEGRALASAVAQAASGTGANTWVVPVNPVQPTAVLAESVSEEVCKQINLISRGDNGIANVVSTTYATQCFSPGGAKFVVVVTKAGYTDLVSGLNDGGTNPPQVITTPLNPADPTGTVWVSPPDTTKSSVGPGPGTVPGAAAVSVTPYNSSWAVSGDPTTGFFAAVDGQALVAASQTDAYALFRGLLYKVKNTSTSHVILGFTAAPGANVAPYYLSATADRALDATLLDAVVGPGTSSMLAQTFTTIVAPTDNSALPLCAGSTDLAPGQSCALFAGPAMGGLGTAPCFSPAAGASFTVNGAPVQLKVESSTGLCSSRQDPVTLSVNGVAAPLKLLPSQLAAVQRALGSLPASVTSQASVDGPLLTLTLSNPNATALTNLYVGEVTSGDGTAPGYERVATGAADECAGVTGGGGAWRFPVLAGHASCTITLGYVPGTGVSGPSALAMYAYNYTASGPSATVAVEKVGLTVANDGVGALKFSTGALAFTNLQNTGTYSAAQLTQQLVITNRSYAPVGFTPQSSGQYPVSDLFVTTSTCGTAVGARATCTMSFQVKDLSQRGAGDYAAQLTFTGSGSAYEGLPWLLNLDLGVSGIGGTCIGTAC